MAKVPNAVEILPKILTACVGRTSVTDRQTDRQTTDGRATAYSEREREFTFAKNWLEGLSNALDRQLVTLTLFAINEIFQASTKQSPFPGAS